MRQVILTRTETSDQGTFGKMVTDRGFTCYVGELPWRDNAHNVSCVMPAPSADPMFYKVEIAYSPKHKRNLYLVQGTPGRGGVEIHVGNWCGDTTQGYRSDVLGCMIVGDDVVMLPPPGKPAQKAVVHSGDTLQAFMEHMDGEPFTLKVEWRRP